MPDVIDEILKFDPGSKPSRKKVKDPDVIDEILKFDPAPGSSKLPREKPVGGSMRETGTISAITGKPLQEYVPRTQPEAGFFTRMKAGLPDDPQAKIRAFAESRGIPASRYRAGPGGQIEYQTDEGRWEREVSELPGSRLESIAAETLGNPSTYLATAGALTPVPGGAALGAMGGELIRKGLARGLYGEKAGTLETLGDVAWQGIFGMSGATAGRVIRWPINRFLAQGTKVLKLAGREVEQGLLTPAEHAKALVIQQLAERHGIDLAPHQIYNKAGMTNTWKYLRQHPNTADAVQKIEEKLATQTDAAIDDFIRDMGGYEKTPYEVGSKLKSTAEEKIAATEAARRTKTSPMYEDAWAKFGDKKVTVTSLLKDIDDRMAQSVSKDPGHRILKDIREMILEAEGDPQKLHRIKVEAIDRVLEKYQGRDPFIMRDAMTVKDKLRDILEHQVKGYKEAQAEFARMSDPIERLKNSVVGRLAGIQKDNELALATHKLLTVATGKGGGGMTDASLLSKAKEAIGDQDPNGWREMVGSYIRDVYENLVSSEEGHLINAAGKLHKRLFGSPRQRQIMQAAMDPGDFQRFSDLMTIFQRAAIGHSKESMTAGFQATGRAMGVIPGSEIYRAAMFMKQYAVEKALGKWNDILMAGRQAELVRALNSPDVVRRLSQMRQLTPGSQKLINAFTVFTTEVANTMGLPETMERVGEGAGELNRGADLLYGWQKPSRSPSMTR